MLECLFLICKQSLMFLTILLKELAYMRNKNKTLGVTIAAAAAIVFATAPITSTVAQAAKKVHCYGVNSCRGKSSCKTAHSDCKGNNSCKGKGVVMKSAAHCKRLGGKIVK